MSQLGLGSSPAVDLEFFGWVPTRSLWELPVFMSLGLLCGIAAFALRITRQVAKRAFDCLEDLGAPRWRRERVCALQLWLLWALRFTFPVLAAVVVVLVSVYGNIGEVLYKARLCTALPTAFRSFRPAAHLARLHGFTCLGCVPGT